MVASTNSGSRRVVQLAAREVLGNGEAAEDTAAAGHGDQASLDAGRRAERGDVLPIEGDGTAGGGEEAADDSQDRGLAGAVGAEQRDQVALRDVEVDPEQDRDPPVGGGDGRDGQQGGGSAGRRVWVRCGRCGGGLRLERAGDRQAMSAGDGPQHPVAGSEEQVAEPAWHDHQQQEQAGPGGEELGGAGEEELGGPHVGGSEDRAGERPEAADDDHGEQLHRRRRAEPVERHGAQSDDVEGSGESGDRPGHAEGGQSHPGRADREGGGGPLVVAHGEDDPPRPAGSDVAGHDEHQRETGEAQVVEAER